MSNREMSQFAFQEKRRMLTPQEYLDKHRLKLRLKNSTLSDSMLRALRSNTIKLD